MVPFIHVEAPYGGQTSCRMLPECMTPLMQPLSFITCHLYLLARPLRPGSSMRVHAGRRRLVACIATHMFPKQRAVLVEARATCPQAPYQVDSNTKEHCMLQFSLETLPSNRPSPRPPQSSYMFQSLNSSTHRPRLMQHIAQSTGLTVDVSATRPNPRRPSLPRLRHKPTAPMYMSMFLTVWGQDVF